MNSEWIWINGELMPLAQATFSVEERGFQFADGVYESFRLYHGRPFATDRHLERLARSCEGIDLAPPDLAVVRRAINAVVDKSSLVDGTVYLQVTRGVAPRNHLFPEGIANRQTVLCYARSIPPLPPPGNATGVKLQTVPDERWKRCWVKSIALIPNVLAKNHAAAQGADEAVFVEGGIITECASSNIFAVIQGHLVTHPVGPKVLPGITRALLLDMAPRLELEVQERPWAESEAEGADELFITSSTREIGWVATWNGRYFKSACPPLTLRLHREFQQLVAEQIQRE